MVKKENSIDFKSQHKSVKVPDEAKSEFEKVRIEPFKGSVEESNRINCQKYGKSELRKPDRF